MERRQRDEQNKMMRLYDGKTEGKMNTGADRQIKWEHIHQSNDAQRFYGQHTWSLSGSVFMVYMCMGPSLKFISYMMNHVYIDSSYTY